ncbi:PilZ domain-containing protein [Metabacillus litoralis]|uniref:PilZ domain-containing protein n=1 Tax=Metabacillus litoralis TaxID=152268 RepID=UPI001B9E29DE|nr:PilZ domain-containing protein [Metabacillus litoralis]UHA60851.1 PilZ domain-containing protein [Metabacillus litoralis]
MRYNRNDPFRYEFLKPLDCQFKIIEINNEKVMSRTANAKIIDLSQSGMKMETELEIPDNNVQVLLQVSFVIVKEKYDMQCMIIWSKSAGTTNQYGLKFNHNDKFLENLTNDLKFHAKYHSL